VYAAFRECLVEVGRSDLVERCLPVIPEGDAGLAHDGSLAKQITDAEKRFLYSSLSVSFHGMF